jgi:polar amino acid transport system ATP-binding protein
VTDPLHSGRAEPRHRTGTTGAPESRPLITVTGVRKRFGANEVLRGVDITIRPHEVLAVIGPSGSGKTTFLRVLNALERVDAGTIVIDGATLVQPDASGKVRYAKAAEIREIRTELGMVFQSFNLFPHMSVMENIIRAPVKVRGLARSEASGLAMELLEKMGLPEKHDSFPHQLSGGQKQRVAIARALAMRPRAMLFDEVTSALDPEVVGEVLKAMRQLVLEGMTMIVVTHEMQFAAEVADRVAMFDEGQIIEFGPPDQIFKAPQSERTATFLRRVVDKE